MIAILSIVKEAGGEVVRILGYGHSEYQARLHAFRFVNNGFNDFDEQFKGGVVASVAGNLATEIESGDLNRYISAVSGLYVQDGVLKNDRIELAS